MNDTEPRGMYDLRGACFYLTIGATKFKELVKAKEIQKVYVDAAPRYPRKSLDAYIERISKRRSA